MLLTLNVRAQKAYNELTVYVVAHQDDWQLFMGANVYKDIVSFDEISPNVNGKKVVIIYTTAGNLHDTDDTKSCNCRDPYENNSKPFPYWKVREAGAKRSVHLAASRIGGWGPGIPYPQNKTVVINGHRITKYEYKNTVSYFLRINTARFGAWYSDPRAATSTVDTSSTYADYSDFVNTIYSIYKAEIDSNLKSHKITFNCQDIDETINPNDHHDHYISGRAASEAAMLLGKETDTCYRQTLFVDYHSQNLPPNLSTPDVQNEAAVTAVYCLALLDYNAWPEWGSLYQEWTGRNYSRTITTCESPAKTNILAQDSLDTLNTRVYPSPADKQLTVRFNLPVITPVDIAIYDVSGATVFHFKGLLPETNFLINTTLYPSGYYIIVVSNGGKPINKTIFDVVH